MHPYAKNGEIDGQQWNWIYLDIPAGLSESGCDEVAKQAIFMHKKKKKQMDIKGEGYEGRMSHKGVAIIGSCVGTALEALLETNMGSTRLCILAEPKYRSDRDN